MSGKINRWAILIAAVCINLCIGSLYSWSVFSGPMAKHLSDISGMPMTAANLAIVFTIANAVGPITMISGGKLNDFLGTKNVIMIGAFLFGGGMILSSFAADKSLLMLGYGLGCGLGMGAVYGCTVSNTVKFFPDKKGFAGGVVTASYGLSSAILPPLINALISEFGVVMTFRAVGIAFLVIIFIGSRFVETYKEEGVEADNASVRADSSADKNWKQMLMSPIFYAMIFMLLCGGFTGIMCISQASNISQSMIGMDAQTGALIVSVLAVFNAFGRVGAGSISDKLGRVNTLRAAFLISFAGLSLLQISAMGAGMTFVIGICLIGISFGAFMGIYPGFTMEQFGAKHNGVNYGIIFIGFASAGYFGPQIMSSIVTASGSYKPAFSVAMGLSAAGLALSFVFERLRKMSARTCK